MTKTEASNSLIKIRLIAPTSTINQIAADLIAASTHLELLDKSKLYASRGNSNESRIYLTFRQKTNDGDAEPGNYDAVLGGNT